VKMNSMTKKSKGLAGVFGLLVALVMVLGLATPVFAVPQPPHQFYGNVTIGGVQAAGGTPISAKIGLVEYASTTVDTDGKYGYNPLFRVPADDPATPAIEGGVAGDTIQFLVGTTAAQTGTFAIGGITQLNLSIVGAAPTVTSISPTSGPLAGGTSVTITGTGFVSGATVTIGGTDAAGVFVSVTSITATTPAGTAGVKNVVVTNPDTQFGTKTGGFTYYDPALAPTVTAILPVSGPTAGGTSVTITGTNFVTGATVTIGGTAATSVAVVSATSITATTPAGTAGAKDVVVTNPDTQSGALTGGFTYTAEGGGGGGGGGGGTPPLDTNLFGTTGSFNINSSGIIQKEIKATSADGNLTITIPKGTKALNKSGNPLSSMTASINSNPPSPPANANFIGLAYNFGPDGATFVPPITFEWKYDPTALPAGVAEEDLVIAYYDATTGKWVNLQCVVDTANNKITASVSHYTTFAIIGTFKPAAFTLSSLVVSPVQVATGEKVGINLSVANTGGTEGSYTVVLNINGVKEAEKSVTVAAGSSQTVTFSVTKAEAGSYSVAVDGLSGSFIVLAPTTPPTTTPPTTTPPTTTPPTTTPPTTTPPTTTPPTTTTPPPEKGFNWPLVGGIIGGVVVIGLIIFFIIKKRM
jgi:hypothetical protein